jgi:CubicO group peptidase (beta-lactamase class C family)
MSKRDRTTDVLVASGSPPPTIEMNRDPTTITGANWSAPENRWWGFRHMDRVCPQPVEITCGDGWVHAFGERLDDLSDVAINYYGERADIERYLELICGKALLVVHDNHVVFERYCGEMTPADRHTWMSVSKTSIAALLGSLVGDGIVDLDRPASEYLKEPVGGWTHARVQDIADMNLVVEFEEVYEDPDSDVYRSEVAGGYRLPCDDSEAHDARVGMRKFLQAYERPAEVGEGLCRYNSANTAVLGFVCEDVTGRRYTELFRDRIWRHIGAERPAGLLVDTQGMGDPGGGLFSTARDLARYGLIFANKGVAPDGSRVFPEAWIDELRRADAGTLYEYGQGYRYHNQIISNGESLAHLGWGGQMLYVHPEKKLVVVAFSAMTIPSAADEDSANALIDLGDAIAARYNSCGR